MILETKLYEINELPLWNFIQCLVKGDFKTLQKSKGFIKKSKLKRHWESIFQQYMEKQGDDTHVFMLNSIKKLAVLKNNIRLFDDHMSFLKNGYHEGLAANLKKIGYTVLNIPNEKQYLAQLKRLHTSAKTMVFNANKIEKDMQKFQETGRSESVKEEDFNEILIILSKNQQYHIHSKNITVVDFIILTKMYKEKNG